MKKPQNQTVKAPNSVGEKRNQWYNKETSHGTISMNNVSIIPINYQSVVHLTSLSEIFKLIKASKINKHRYECPL